MKRTSNLTGVEASWDSGHDEQALRNPEGRMNLKGVLRIAGAFTSGAFIVVINKLSEGLTA